MAIDPPRAGRAPAATARGWRALAHLLFVRPRRELNTQHTA